MKASRLTVSRKFDLARRRRRTIQAENKHVTDHPRKGRIPRIARLMALAIRFDGLIRSGQVADRAELARLGHVTRARVTQIMNLLHLAPDIQEELLFLPRVTNGRDPIAERHIRPIARLVDWSEQRKRWRDLLQSTNQQIPTQTG